MKSRTFNRGAILRVFMMVVLAAGMASLPGQGARAAIDATSFAAHVDFDAFNIEPSDIAIGDLDGDGKPDMAVTNFSSNTVSVLRNTSTSGTIDASSFAAKVDFGTGNIPYGIAIGDLDGDGKPDLVVANVLGNTVSVLRNTSTSGSVSFAAKVDFGTGSNPYFVAIGDLDGDGKLDLAVANNNSDTVSVLRNTSTSGTIDASSFAAKVDFGTGTNPYGIAIGDLDGDGKPDLAVTNPSSDTVSVLRNTSAGIGSISFAAKVDFGTGSIPLHVAIGDLDGDGKPDLAVTNEVSDTVSVLRNTSPSGSVSFAAKVDFGTGISPYGVAIGDLDGDGKPDLAVTNVWSNTVSVLRNTSTSGTIDASSFAAKVDFGTEDVPCGVAIVDLDGDGKPDLAVANRGLSVSVLRHTTPDTTPPVVTINSISPNPTNSGTTVTWHAGENGTYSVRVGGADCATGAVVASGAYSTSPATVASVIAAADLSAGSNTLRVCVTDAASNTGSVTGSVTKEATAPPVVLPVTGFAPDRVTVLPPQSVAYTQSDLWLEIPKLGVKMNIVGVPQTNGTWDVSWLGSDAGWLNGSAFPTWAGNSVLTGHVWNADNTPGPFASVSQLWWGDKIIIHAWGGEYVYEVRAVMQVSPGDTAAMMKHQELPWLTLVTCRGYNEATGTYKYRVLIRAVLVEVK